MMAVSYTHLKAAVKGNTAMSYQEMDALMDQLMKLDNPYPVSYTHLSQKIISL